MSHIRSVLLWENQRRFVREAIDEGSLKVALVPVGATEQHNEHLRMIHDTQSAVYICKKVAESMFPNVVVTTPMPVGVSEHWMDHKGTLSLRPEIFCEAVYDICHSMYRHGIQHIVIVNGHAGNIVPLNNKLPELRDRMGHPIHFCSYWEAYSDETIKKYMKSGNCPGHASEFETSFAMAAFPENIDWNGVDYNSAKLTIRDPEMAVMDREFHEEAKLASGEAGQAMIDIAASWVADKVRVLLGT